MKQRWSARRHGLTIKLIAIYLGISLLGVFLVSAAMRYAFREGFQENIKPHLTQYVRYIQNDLGNPPQLRRARQLARALPLEIYFRSDTRQWSTDGGVFPALDDIHFHRRGRYFDAPVKWGYRDGDGIAVITTDSYTLLFVSPDDDDYWEPTMLLPLLIIVGIFAALYYLTQRLFAPLHTIRQAVNAFGSGDLGQRLALDRKDELGDVAYSFNQMADRIQKMLESKRQLLLAISHELRSPLTRAKVATAMLRNDRQRSEIESELSEMEALTSELLETERLNADHDILNLKKLNLVDLLSTIARSLDEPITLELPREPVWLQADEMRLRLVVKNLLGNALKYTPAEEPRPILSLSRADAGIRFTVRDYGMGIAPEHLRYIGEPFYRADPARQRATGGYGLGLYLCRMIVKAHGGSLHIDSILEQGTSIVVYLPLNEPENNFADEPGSNQSSTT